MVVHSDVQSKVSGTFTAEVQLTEYGDHGEYKFDLPFSFPSPNECPHCYSKISPNLKHIDTDCVDNLIGPEEGIHWTIYVFFGCPACKRPFYALYMINRVKTSSRSDFCKPKILEIGPYQHKSVSFSDSIKFLSPQFCKIYNEANAAEKYQLNEIAGPGYRKALEFLVKDYSVRLHPDEKSLVESNKLATCISKYIDNKKIKLLAEKSAWIGNDETHYLRKHEDRNIEDFKKLVNAMVNYIEMELAVEDAESIIRK